ncbi:papilin-like [Strongylocentrotus purpuratus]|uniref:ADAMTS/ADAMTS-like Spacer 1 domain-containing protein n=1 Tax=Strongylocentrotus purpuratus TaxID=7668 RepID=A0A7M7PKM8_STRPU|nr:papilin-like [Strongylocentrotus purpuratus]
MVKITNHDGKDTAFGMKIDGKIIFRPRFRNSRYPTNGLESQRYTIGDMHILLRLQHYAWSQIRILSGPTTKPINIEIMDERLGYQTEYWLRTYPETFYEWYEPISDPVSYHWDLNPLTECSVSCGGGNQTIMPICMEEINGTRVNVSDRFCLKTSAKPSHIHDCNTQLCPGAIWLIGSWSQCSVTCENGIKERLVECIEGSTGEVLAASECVVTEGYTPMNNTMPCSQPVCPTGNPTLSAEEEATILTTYNDSITHSSHGGLPPVLSIPLLSFILVVSVECCIITI